MLKGCQRDPNVRELQQQCNEKILEMVSVMWTEMTLESPGHACIPYLSPVLPQPRAHAWSPPAQTDTWSLHACVVLEDMVGGCGGAEARGDLGVELGLLVGFTSE